MDYEFPLSEGVPLPWILREQSADSGIVGEGGDDIAPFPFWPEDSNEEIDVVVKLSLNQYVAITSALDIGAAIGYGDSSLLVKWFLYRNFGGDAVPICVQIIGCIESDADVQQAIRDFIEGDDELNTFITQKVVGLTTGQIVGPLAPGDCDASVLAGRIVQIVEKMNDINVDFLEIVEVGTNDEERAAAIVGAIPGVGTLPADEIINFVQGLLTDFTENYAAAITEEWKDEVEEDLYCIARNNPDCALSFQDVFDYFQGRVGSGLTITSLIGQVVNFILDGDFNTDDLIASGMYALQLGAVLASNKFAGMTLPTMGGLVRDADTSTKWEEWDDCPTPEPLNINMAPGFDAYTCEHIETYPNGSERWRMTRNFNTGAAACVAYDPDHYFKIISNEIVEGTFTNQVAWVTYPGITYGENFTGIYPSDLNVYSFYRWPDGNMPQVFDVILMWAGNQ